MTTTDDTIDDFLRQQFLNAATAVPSRPRGMADLVEAEAARATAEKGYTKAAARITHEMMWGMANASLDRVVRTAAKADALTSRGEP